MYVKEIKQIISNLPDNTEIKIEDNVGDTFGTLGVSYKPNENALTFFVDDIIF